MADDREAAGAGPHRTHRRGQERLGAAAGRSQAPVEIISVDSALVYRGLDIGTAKPAARGARARSAPSDRHLRPERELLRRALRARTRCAVHPRHSRGGAACRCWSAARCCTCARCCTDLRRCRRRAGSCGASIDARAARAAGRRCTPSSRGSTREAAARIAPNDAPAHSARARGLPAHRPADLAAATRDARRRCRTSRVRYWMLAPARSRACCTSGSQARFAAMMAAGFLDEVAALHRRGDLTGAPSVDARGRLPAAVGAPRGEYGSGGGGATSRCGDAPTCQAAAHLDARGRLRRRWIDPDR